MKYQIRPGIFYRKILDEHFLIAAAEAAADCSEIRQINSGAAYYWNLLESGLEPEQMLDEASRQSGIDREKLRPGLEHFLKELTEQKYIICVEDEQD